LTSDVGVYGDYLTVNLLANLGYQRLSVSSFASTDDKAATEGFDELFIDVSTQGAAVTLDFTELTMHGTNQPRLSVDGVTLEKPYLYRSIALSNPTERRFGVLRSATLSRASLPLDISSVITETELAKKEYEIAFFVVAFGRTSSLLELYSIPKPWGIIRPINP